MRKLLRQRVRLFFGIQAVALFLLALRSLLHVGYAGHRLTPLRRYILLVVCSVLSMVFAKAWRTTYRPRLDRNPWAMTASLVSIAAGVFFLWIYRPGFLFAAPGLIAIAIGVGGLYIYAECGMSPEATSEASPASASATAGQQ